LHSLITASTKGVTWFAMRLSFAFCGSLIDLHASMAGETGNMSAIFLITFGGSSLGGGLGLFI
jgi:hypothetical protein